jgi:hypothetical protein
MRRGSPAPSAIALNKCHFCSRLGAGQSAFRSRAVPCCQKRLLNRSRSMQSGADLADCPVRLSGTKPPNGAASSGAVSCPCNCRFDLHRGPDPFDRTGVNLQHWSMRRQCRRTVPIRNRGDISDISFICRPVGSQLLSSQTDRRVL